MVHDLVSSSFHLSGVVRTFCFQEGIFGKEDSKILFDFAGAVYINVWMEYYCTRCHCGRNTCNIIAMASKPDLVTVNFKFIPA